MKVLTFMFLFAILLPSCNQSGCSNNSNAILSQNDKNTWSYQNELMRLIEQNPTGVEYYFERRAEIEGESFIVLNCYGTDFCGELKTKSVIKNLESLKLQNNKGFSGAKLEGVVLKKETLKNGHEVFAFEKLDRIVD